MTQSDQIILYYVTGNADGQDNVESENAKENERKLGFLHIPTHYGPQI